MSGTTVDLIPIDEAAKTLRRSVHTLRRWSLRGRAPTGHRLRVHRDRITTIRFFESEQIEAIRAAMFDR